jgi:hypothetical protein
MGKSKIIDIDAPSIRVISKKTSPIDPPKEEPKKKKPGRKPDPSKKPEPERMKDGTQPKGTGRGGNPPPEEGKFKAGTTPNPGGRPKDPPGLKEMKFLTKAELVLVGNMILQKTPDELLEIIGDESEATALQRMIGSIVDRIIRKGDMVAFNILLDRLIGKVKEEVRGDFNLNLTEGGEVRVAGVKKVFSLPSNGRERNQNQSA